MASRFRPLPRSPNTSSLLINQGMKKKTAEDLDDDLRPHYDFDYTKMKRNRFAGMKLFVPKRQSKRPSSKKRAP